jgi:hypothetical protein
LIIIVDNVLLDLLDNSIRYSLKHNCHRLSPFTLCTNIFLELLVNLLSDSASPPNNLIVNKLHTLVQILSLLTLLLQPSDFVIENLQLRADDGTWARLLAGIVVICYLHLQLV